MRPSFGVPPLPRSRSERVEEEEGKTFLSLYSFFFLLALLLLLSVVAFVFITCESAIVLIFIVFSFLVKKISSRIKSTPFALFCFLSLCSRMTSSCRSSARLSFISRIFTCSSRKRLCPFTGLSAGNFSGFRALSCAFAGHGTCNSIAFFRNSASFRKENSGFCHLFVFSNFRGSIACGSFERCCWNFCDALRYIRWYSSLFFFSVFFTKCASCEAHSRARKLSSVLFMNDFYPIFLSISRRRNTTYILYVSSSQPPGDRRRQRHRVHQTRVRLEHGAVVRCSNVRVRFWWRGVLLLLVRFNTKQKGEKDESNFPGNGNSKKKKKKKAYEYYSHHNHASKSLQDLNYSIGEDALAQINSKTIKWPISNGIVNDWTSMEKFWQKTLLNVLRVEPEEHFFLLTEPPLNPAENRERIGEIMFETFNVPGVHIGVQAVLALNASVALNASAAAASSKKNRNGDEENSGNDTSKKDRNDGLTGTVIDIGDGVTHVIPVCDGYVVSSAIKSVPLAGRDLTRFVQTLMRERGENVPAEEFSRVAQKVKEKYCYVSKDIAKEFELHERNPKEYVIRMEGVRAKTNLPWQADVGYERFLAPEVFFRPDMIAEKENGFGQFSLPELVDNAIQECPIDSRRKLYGNIVLSGGSTMFKGFGKRVKRDVKRVVDKRISESEVKSGNRLKAKSVDVEVFTHDMQRYAVWFGGSVVASMPDFYKSCHTREEYFEYGSQVMRSNVLEKEEVFF